MARATMGRRAMMGRNRSWPAALLVLVLAAVAGIGPARADDPAFFAFSAAWYDVYHQDDSAIEARIEYRSDRKFWIFKPFGGLMATSDFAAYGFAGVLVDVYFGRRLVLTPSFAAGLYHDGDGTDLGFPVQFRSQLEIAYRFDDRSRLGLSYNHLSNAGLDDRNPGVESLAITYSIPITDFFRLAD